MYEEAPRISGGLFVVGGGRGLCMGACSHWAADGAVALDDRQAATIATRIRLRAACKTRAAVET